MLRTTPFHARTAPLVQGQAWRRWAGCAVASAYHLLHDREYAALRGPLSRAILARLCEGNVGELKYFRLLDTRLREIPVTVSRTGYTGDLGYEIWVGAQQAVELWDALVDGGAPYGITPAGIWALDLARIEAGLIMLDVDYHSSRRAVLEEQKSSPLELGLDWTVSFDK